MGWSFFGHGYCDTVVIATVEELHGLEGLAPLLGAMLAPVSHALGPTTILLLWPHPR